MYSDWRRKQRKNIAKEHGTDSEEYRNVTRITWYDRIYCVFVYLAIYSILSVAFPPFIVWMLFGPFLIFGLGLMLACDIIDYKDEKRRQTRVNPEQE